MNNAKTALKTTLVALTWVPVLLTVNQHVVSIARIDGSSMRPTFNPAQGSSDWVILWKWKCHSDAKPGDVVLFRSPINPEKVYCKRVKGINGDLIRTTSPYPKPVTGIPRNHMWCEGDNVFHSVDSNEFGPVSMGLCMGKCTHVIWPPSRWQSIKNEGGRAALMSRDEINEYHASRGL